MAQRLADRLNAARQRQFVGRKTELTVFQTALEAASWPFVLVYVHGPGGVGKTALLSEYRRRCQAAGVGVLHLDARHVEPT